MAKRKLQHRKTSIEIAVLAILLFGVAIIAEPQPSEVPVAIPSPVQEQEVKTIFEGKGVLPSFHLKHLGPLAPRIYEMKLSSDNPVNIILVNSFEDIEKFAQGQTAVYYTGCRIENTTAAILECAVFDGAFVAVYNSGQGTASVNLVVNDLGTPPITGLVITSDTSTITLPYPLTSGPLR